MAGMKLGATRLLIMNTTTKDQASFDELTNLGGGAAVLRLEEFGGRFRVPLRPRQDGRHEAARHHLLVQDLVARLQQPDLLAQLAFAVLECLDHLWWQEHEAAAAG